MISFFTGLLLSSWFSLLKIEKKSILTREMIGLFITALLFFAHLLLFWLIVGFIGGFLATALHPFFFLLFPIFSILDWFFYSILFRSILGIIFFLVAFLSTSEIVTEIKFRKERKKKNEFYRTDQVDIIVIIISLCLGLYFGMRTGNSIAQTTIDLTTPNKNGHFYFF